MIYIWIFVVCFIQSAFTQDISNEAACFKLFTGSANVELAKMVADQLGIEFGQADISKFNDGEIRIQIQENIRNCDIYILQSICNSRQSTVNDNLIELFLMIRAMKRASANNITAVVPYYGYARQDRKITSRVPISASDIAMMLELAGADQVMAIDLHSGQIQGFFHKVLVDNLSASKIFVPYIVQQNLQDPVIISPDAGGVERARTFIEGLETQGINSRLAVIIKHRAEAGIVESMDLVGNVNGSDVVIIDDICDTAGTLVQAAQELKNNGARRVFACITHPIFSGPAINRISSSCIDKLIVTNTIPLLTSIPANVEQISIAPLIAEAILRTSHGQSLKELFLN